MIPQLVRPLTKSLKTTTQRLQLMDKIACYALVLILLQACNPQRPVNTSMNTPGEEYKELSWVGLSDPAADAQKALAAGDTKLLVNAGRGTAVPGLSTMDAAIYRKKCGVKILPGSTDAIRDEIHHKQLKAAHDYAKTYNWIIAKHCSKDNR